MSKHYVHQYPRILEAPWQNKKNVPTMKILTIGARELRISVDMLSSLVIGSSDKNIVTCTAGILSNITCNNTHNKVISCEEKGIGALVSTILEAENEEIVEPVIRTLRHLTCRNPVAETDQNDVRLHSGLQAIVKFLCPDSRWPLKKSCHWTSEESGSLFK
ncbi:Armadillo segment polarity protein [Araneus ventricosus]|uniref:Armadillo segment polarity protein n=1 Tax=Araneus ventricosus TaxID=182803 RepID=A0A4Y2C8P9_ARAVE|nr:Armadillo segment polarity protein [Araneus ventricosus]